MNENSPRTFEDFMQHALHDPQDGYYARHISGLGQRGDFTTAPILSSAPAKAIASWATHALRDSKCRNLIEIGPGDGSLAAAVRQGLPWSLRQTTRLHLVETSPPLTKIQQKLLEKRATWHPTPSAALAACHGRAVIFSNELVDAFPVRRYQKTPLGWQELAITRQADGQIRESLMSPAPLPDSSAFSDHHAHGQWIEVHNAYRRWLTNWLPHWRAGRMLTIDYGATADTLYHRRPHGTLRAYLFQQRLEGQDIYQNPGRQDLTADVNFTDLIRWSAPWTESPRLLPLAEFLRHHADPTLPVDQFLTSIHGAGTAFLVLDEQCAHANTA